MSTIIVHECDVCSARVETDDKPPPSWGFSRLPRTQTGARAKDLCAECLQAEIAAVVAVHEARKAR